MTVVTRPVQERGCQPLKVDDQSKARDAPLMPFGVRTQVAVLQDHRYTNQILANHMPLLRSRGKVGETTMPQPVA